MSVNLADPRVKRTRKLIKDAFTALLAEKSFRELTVQDVAERATVNRATFYAHFLDKYALLDQVVVEHIRAALQRRFPAELPFTLENLQIFIEGMLDYAAESHDRRPKSCVVCPGDEHTVQKELYLFLKDWLGRAPLHEAADPATQETIAVVLSWAIFGAGMEWRSGPRTGTAAERAAQVLALLAPGLSGALPDARPPRAEPRRGLARPGASRKISPNRTAEVAGPSFP